MKRARGEGKVNATKTFTPRPFPPPRFRFSPPSLPRAAFSRGGLPLLQVHPKRPSFAMLETPSFKKQKFQQKNIPDIAGHATFILLVWFPFHYHPPRPKNPAGDSRPRPRCPVPAACKSPMSSAHPRAVATFALQEHRCYFA